MTRLEQAVPENARLVLDSSVLIAYLGADEPISPVARELVQEFLGSERNDAVLSTLAAGEILVDPAKRGTQREVAFDIMDMPGLQLRSVDFLVAAEAARIRSEIGLRMPDAVVVATGVLTGSQILVTNDQRMAAAVPQVVPEMQVVLLSDLV